MRDESGSGAGQSSAAGETAIPMEKTRVAALADLVDNQGQRFDVGESRIAVIRIGDGVRVLGDRCSHANYSLAEGEVDCDNLTLECWKHGALFNLETGEAETLPAIKPVPVYEAEVVDGEVFVMLPVSKDEEQRGQQ